MKNRIHKPTGVFICCWNFLSIWAFYPTSIFVRGKRCALFPLIVVRAFLRTERLLRQKKRHTHNRSRRSCDISKNTCEPYVRFISKVWGAYAPSERASECTQCVLALSHVCIKVQAVWCWVGGWRRKRPRVSVCSWSFSQRRRRKLRDRAGALKKASTRALAYIEGVWQSKTCGESTRKYKHVKYSGRSGEHTQGARHTGFCGRRRRTEFFITHARLRRPSNFLHQHGKNPIHHF